MVEQFSDDEEHNEGFDSEKKRDDENILLLRNEDLYLVLLMKNEEGMKLVFMVKTEARVLNVLPAPYFSLNFKNVRVSIKQKRSAFKSW